ncbi:MAG: dual specificity protein phosphatase family protein [Proteobacteria bacterium]|nr:dual specificity protein phosphatase family protein [Pseudomonadota bacterium]
MGLFDRATDRLLALLGLELDLAINLHGEPFHQIRDGLFVGSRPSAADVQALKHAGITHVVSCLEAHEREQIAFLAEDFETLFIPARDSMHHELASAFPAFFDFAADANLGGESQLLVHCQAGVSRSGTLATAWLMKTEGLGFYEAFSSVRSQRAGVLPNIGFASQLGRLEAALQPERVEGGSLARYLHEVCNVPVELEVLRGMLERHEDDAPRALKAIFGGEIPRVVQGVRV